MKRFYQSKTLWFNALVLLVAVAGVFGFGEFKPSSEMIEIISVVVAAINIVLRLVTNQSLK